MQLNPININSKNTFGHNNPWADSPYDNSKKRTVIYTTALGVFTGMACHAKYKGFSLNPKKIFGTSLSPKKIYQNLKNSYWGKIKFDDEPVIAIGAGSCLGGLAGGYLIDKDKENRKSKKREALLQMTNITLPIVFTTRMAKWGQQLGNKYWDKSRPKNSHTFRTKVPQGIFAMAGLFAGVFTANIVANKINEKIFHQGKGRPVQASDFSAHLDDFCVAAQQIHDGGIIKAVSRLVPIALMVAGNEVGNTTVENADS